MQIEWREPAYIILFYLLKLFHIRCIWYIAVK
nr:MAG TPA: hypothetical protein [Caudoviricetes sp.]